MPEISVLLSVYNPDRNELIEAVQSVIAQTFSGWEMILYDDGSDENYKAFIYEISLLDERIRYVRSSDHHSLAYGLNQSLKMASGEYAARMDADDISLPERFSRQLTFLESHRQYLWVGSNIALIDSKGEIWGERHYPMIPESRDFLKYSPYAHPSVMFRRKELLRYGGYFKGERACRGEDYELFMRLHGAGERGFNLQEILLQYRETRSSYDRRKLRFQFQEAGIRFEGFRRMGIISLKSMVYVIKPVIVWMVPKKVKHAIHKRPGINAGIGGMGGECDSGQQEKNIQETI